MDKKIGEWIINYLPEEGGRYTGTLEVSDEKVRFTSLYESSNKTIVKAIFIDVATYAASGGRLIYRYSNNKEAIVELPVNEIAGAEATKKGLMNRAEIIMKNGQKFVFNYGLLSVKKLIKTVSTLIKP